MRRFRGVERALIGLALLLAVPAAVLAGLVRATNAGPTLDPERDASIRQSITIAADYAATRLLDEDGRSRCDYDITTGRWREYEPAWRIGIMGASCTRRNVVLVLGALESILCDMNVKLPRGAALAAAGEVYS